MTTHDWRLDAMAEFFNAEFVRIGEDGEPVNNNTTQTRSDIYQFDDDEIAAHPIVERMVRDARRAAWQELEAAMLTSLFAQLGSGATVSYIGQEGTCYWAELTLPEQHYTKTLATACADTPDAALAAVVHKAVTEYAKVQEGEQAA